MTTERRATPHPTPHPDSHATTHPSRALELRETVRRVVGGSLPGERSGPPAQRDLAQLRTLDPGDAPQLWTESNVHLLEAMLIARVRLDDIEGALALVETHFTDGRLRTRAVLGLDTLASLFAAVGEAYAAAGRPRDAGLYASHALMFADSDPVRYRASAVQTLIFALNGEFDAATTTRALCDGLARDNGWSPLDTDYALVLGEVLLAVAAFDADRVARASGLLRSIAPRDPYAQHAAATADAITRILHGDIAAGVAGLRTVIGGAWSHLSHRLVRDLALSVLADATLAQGSARRALSVLDGRDAAPDHTVCFDAQRAAAHLALGDDRAALDVTDACLALGAAHCPRTLAGVLVRRAIARERRGQADAADDLFDEATALVFHTGGSLAPFVTVPQTSLAVLFARLASRRPTLAPQIEAVRQQLRAAVPDTVPAGLPALTPREGSVAVALRGGKTYAQIADDFVVSVNTVKSQMRSLFAKLGVSSRNEAIAVLERHGFYL
ncbi:helix-turn-helix transcriptional regulator [Microbacterium sp. cf332]|uniref:helix-turn-helix transcriptional regulator n=1 Tax=Microbacterium sp. cf332 TaxID=1761804 RepID=UPI000889D759|nr:helix-turn-helix transcriptional regulator [Microbacterium sp. cf332]SDQ96698.1 regulatory protein, luxR family [Microbacterium sp. cf332]